MKRELAFALGVQSQLASPLGRTRSSQPQSQSELSQCDGGPESEDLSSKRLKVSSVIVYTRRGKIRNGISEDLKVEQLQKGEEAKLEAFCGDAREGEIVIANGTIEEQCNCISDKFLSEEEQEIDKDGLVEIVVEENFGRPREKDGLCEVPRVDSGGGLVDVQVQEDASRKLGSFFSKGDVEAIFLGGTSGSLRRFTWSLVKEDVAACMVDEATINVDEKAKEVDSLENLRVTTSGRKIVHNKKLMTVKDLFETGLLDGVVVVYMAGTNKVDLLSFCMLL